MNVNMKSIELLVELLSKREQKCIIDNVIICYDLPVYPRKIPVKCVKVDNLIYCKS